MKLTDKAIKSAKPKDKPYKMSDGEGMFLLISPNGSKLWRLKYRYNKKEKLLALGSYPQVTLAMAREKRVEAKNLISQGIDPSHQKKVEKLTRYQNAENSFETVALEWHENQKPSWTERHANYVLKRLEADILPVLGSRPIAEITAPELLVALKSVEKRGALDIAHRLLQTTGQIFRYAIAVGKAKHDISADLRGALQARKKQHFNKLQEKELPEFLQKLDGYDQGFEGDTQTKLALKLLVYTFVRTSEIRGARWTEFDLEKKEWRIPAERMKMREEHIVPLSNQVLKILEELKPVSRHRELLFPNRTKPILPMSENTMLFALYRMGYRGRTTTHGFRATASTILHEKGFNSDIIELQLSHSERNKVKASYNFAKRLPERHEMMHWWADYLDELKTS